MAPEQKMAPNYQIKSDLSLLYLFEKGMMRQKKLLKVWLGLQAETADETCQNPTFWGSK